jgi:hypothetical protein
MLDTMKLNTMHLTTMTHLSVHHLGMLALASESRSVSQPSLVSPNSAVAKGQDRPGTAIDIRFVGRGANAAVCMHVEPTAGFWGYTTKPATGHSQRLRVAT